MLRGIEMKTKLLLLISLLVLSACSTLKVETDYNPSVDISAKKSFTIVHKANGDNSIVVDRINAAIKTDLQAKGYTFVKEGEADFDVIYEYGKKNQTDIESDFTPVGLFGGYTTLDTYKYTQGQFALRMIDPKTKKTFWSADAKNQLDQKDTPQERTAYVNKLISKILEKYPAK